MKKSRRTTYLLIYYIYLSILTLQLCIILYHFYLSLCNSLDGNYLKRRQQKTIHRMCLLNHLSKISYYIFCGQKLSKSGYGVLYEKIIALLNFASIPNFTEK